MAEYDYFISSRWRNRDQVLELAAKLRAKGKRVYCFLDKWSAAKLHDDPEAVMAEFESTPDWRQDERVRRIFEGDMEGLKGAERLVMLLPAGKSCHLEAGVAWGLGKECVLIGEQREAETLYLIFRAVYPTIDAFIADVR